MFCAYLEQNTVNGKFYSGKGPWKKRRASRIWHAHNPQGHWHNSLICRAYRKHGSDAFVLHTTCLFDTEEAAFEQEKAWIRELNLMNPEKGYNLTLGGEGTSGYVYTPEHRQKLSIAHKGKPAKNLYALHSPESRRKAGLANRGRKQSPEEIAKRMASFHQTLATIGRRSKPRPTHCLRGHVLPEIDENGKRKSCKECRKIRDMAAKA
jgi:hypothetical protein